MGGGAVLFPGFARLKEWAYAGMIFDLTGIAGTPRSFIAMRSKIGCLTGRRFSRRALATPQPQHPHQATVRRGRLQARVGQLRAIATITARYHNSSRCSTIPAGGLVAGPTEPSKRTILRMGPSGLSPPPAPLSISDT